MGEQEQETTVAKSKSSSAIVLAVIAVVIVAAVVVWLGWGTASRQASVTTPAEPVVVSKPVEPEKPRPTVAVGVSPKLLSPTKLGTFEFGGILCCVIHYDGQWRGMDQQYGFAPEAGYPRTEGNTWEMKAKWSPNRGDFDWHHLIKRIDPQTLDYDLSLKSDAGGADQCPGDGDQPAAEHVLRPADHH